MFFFYFMQFALFFSLHKLLNMVFHCISVFRNIYSYNRPTFSRRCRMFVGSVHDKRCWFQVIAVCHEAALKALEENLSATNVKHSHFMSALQLVIPRTPSSLLKLYETYLKHSWDLWVNKTKLFQVYTFSKNICLVLYLSVLVDMIKTCILILYL